MLLRVLLRSHRVYAMILRDMLKPSRLRSAEARDAWLNRIWARTPEERRATLRELEREDFLNLDFPDYYIFAGETDIRRPDGTVVLRSALRVLLECAVERLESLSDETLRAASEELRGIFAALRTRKALAKNILK